MAKDSYLTTQRRGDTIVVSWRDAISNSSFFARIMWPVYLAPVVYAVVFILPADLRGEAKFMRFMGTILIGPFAGMALWWTASMIIRFRFVDRSVSINSKTITVDGKTYPTKSASRVEYGDRGAWDASDHTKINRTQIRIWLDDREYVVVGENDWTKDANHQIRDALDRALDTARKDQAAQEKADKFGDHGDLGMPDY